MNKCALIYFVVGVTISLTASAMFMDWMKMPMDMANSMMDGGQQVQQPRSLICDCRCKD